MISNRHIRHDWPEWVDWDNQKSVKTMCGVRSRPGLCGVPGVTHQDERVIRGDIETWGWCMRCVKLTFPYYLPEILTIKVTSPFIITLHSQARVALSAQYYAHLVGQLNWAKPTGSTQTLVQLSKAIKELEQEYPWVTAPR